MFFVLLKLQALSFYLKSTFLFIQELSFDIALICIINQEDMGISLFMKEEWHERRVRGHLSIIKIPLELLAEACAPLMPTGTLMAPL